MARLSAWWRSSSRSSWPSWWCERSSNGRVDRRSTATSSSSAKRGSDRDPSPSARLPIPGVTPSRGTRARPTWRASSPGAMARIDAPCLRDARRARAPDPCRSDRAADGAPGRRLRTGRIRECGRCRRPSTVERSSAGGAFVRSTVSRGTGPIGRGGPTDRPRRSAGDLDDIPKRVGVDGVRSGHPSARPTAANRPSGSQPGYRPRPVAASLVQAARVDGSGGWGSGGRFAHSADHHRRPGSVSSGRVRREACRCRRGRAVEWETGRSWGGGFVDCE